MSKSDHNPVWGKKKGGVHLRIRTEKTTRKKAKKLAARLRRWYKLHPELKPEEKGESPMTFSFRVRIPAKASYYIGGIKEGLQAGIYLLMLNF